MYQDIAFLLGSKRTRRQHVLTEEILDEFGDMSNKILDPTGTADCHSCNVTTKSNKTGASLLHIRKLCFTPSTQISISKSEFCKLMSMWVAGRRNREQARSRER
jgi:hypothetical protein